MLIDRYGLMDDADIEVDVAALHLSALDHEAADLDSYLAVLQAIADRLAAVGAGAQAPDAQAEALAQVLHREFGFTGDSESYDAPLNADMIRVIDRRRGLPVSLSILHVAAARRMGWTAYALNMPGHVLVRVGDADSVITDPFAGGHVLTMPEIGALLRRMLGEAMLPPAQVAPMSNRAALLRLLSNQIQRAENDGDEGRALIVQERAVRIAPEHADGWWRLARLQLRQGLNDAARLSLTSMLEVTRDARDRERIAALLGAIAAG